MQVVPSFSDLLFFDNRLAYEDSVGVTKSCSHYPPRYEAERPFSGYTLCPGILPKRPYSYIVIYSIYIYIYIFFLGPNVVAWEPL